MAKALISLGFVILASLIVKGTTRDPEWAKRLLDVIQVRDSIIGPLDDLKKEMNTPNIEKIIETLQKLPSKLAGLDSLDVTAIEQNRPLVKQLFDQLEEPMVTPLFRSKTLESYYKDRGFGFMLRTFRGYHSYRCIQMLFSGAKPLKGYNIPINAVCSRLKQDIANNNNNNKHVLSTATICPNVKQCSGSTKPFPYGDKTDGTDIKFVQTTTNVTLKKHYP